MIRARGALRAVFLVVALSPVAGARERGVIAKRAPAVTRIASTRKSSSPAKPAHRIVAPVGMKAEPAEHPRPHSPPALVRTAKAEEPSLVLAVLESAAPVHDADEPDEPRSSKATPKKKDDKHARKARPARPLPPGATWKAYRRAPWRRGYVTMAGHGKQWSGYLVGPDGEVNPAARRALSSELSSWRTGKQITIDDRLIQLIADTSDEFGGRTIRVVSGYRESSYAPDSKHKVGQAFDFSIPGVPNEMLRDFLRSLPDVGVGYYPNSTHVHLDVREKPCYWVDYSRPGQAPVYSYARRVDGLSPAERALAAALDTLIHRTFGHTSSGQGDHSGGESGPGSDSGAAGGGELESDDEVEQ